MKIKKGSVQFAAAQRIAEHPEEYQLLAPETSRRKVTTSLKLSSPEREKALHAAVCENNIEKAAALLQEEGDATLTFEGSPLLHYAVLHKHAEMVMLLLSQGGDVNSLGSYGNTPLHEAMLNLDQDKLRIVELLLLAGANPNIQNVFGQTPLHFHVQSDRELYQEGAKLLLSSGAHLHLCDIKGNMPFDRLSPLIRDTLIEYALEVRLKRS